MSWINHEVVKGKYFVCTILYYRHDCLLFMNLNERVTLMKMKNLNKLENPYL